MKRKVESPSRTNLKYIPKEGASLHGVVPKHKLLEYKRTLYKQEKLEVSTRKEKSGKGKLGTFCNEDHDEHHLHHHPHHSKGTNKLTFSPQKAKRGKLIGKYLA